MRRRQAFNPFQVGDRVVIYTGALSGIAGQVVGRDDRGRVVVAFDGGFSCVEVRITHRAVRHDPQYAPQNDDEPSL
jgi:hypothetical protein